MNLEKNTICIAGKNDIAIQMVEFILEHHPGIQVIGMINGSDIGIDGYFKSYKKFLEKKKIPVVQLQDVYKINDLIFISLEFDKIIKPQLFLSTQLYNIHFSLLPAYKGMFTSAWPIINQEENTGVTLHKIDRGIDTGDIADQIKIKIEPEETAKTLYKKYMRSGLELMKKNFADLIADRLIFYPQKSQGSTYYSKKTIDYKNLSLDLNVTAAMLNAKLRAFTYREYQLPAVFGQKIQASDITTRKSEFAAGHLVMETDTTLEISTIDFNIVLYKDTFDQIIAACKQDDIESLKKYFHKNLLEEQTPEGWTPLIVACYNNSVNCAAYLLANQANVNATNYKGTSVLMYAKDGASNFANKKIVDMILSHKPDIYHKDQSDKSIFDYINNESFITEDYIKSKI